MADVTRKSATGNRPAPPLDPVEDANRDLKPLSLKRLAEELSQLRADNLALRDKVKELESAPVPAEDEERAASLASQLDKAPQSASILRELSELVSKIGNDGRRPLYWRTAQGLKPADPKRNPEDTNLLKLAEDLAIKNGYNLYKRWIVVAENFWRNKCMETGKDIYAYWKRTQRGGWFPAVGGKCIHPRQFTELEKQTTGVTSDEPTGPINAVKPDQVIPSSR